MRQNYWKNRCPVFVINTVIVEMIQSTVQASLTPHSNVLIITSWGPLPRGLSQIINCSIVIFSWPSCVCSRTEELTPLLATIPPVTELPAGTASSFHQGSFYNQRTYYYWNSVTSCDWADCWSSQPIKAAYKTVQPQTPFSKNPVWHGWSPWVLLGDAFLRESPATLRAVVKLSSLLA